MKQLQLVYQISVGKLVIGKATATRREEEVLGRGVAWGDWKLHAIVGGKKFTDCRQSDWVIFSLIDGLTYHLILNSGVQVKVEKIDVIETEI